MNIFTAVIRLILIAMLVVTAPAEASISTSLTQKALRKVSSMMIGASTLLMCICTPTSLLASDTVNGSGFDGLAKLLNRPAVSKSYPRYGVIDNYSVSYRLHHENTHTFKLLSLAIKGAIMEGDDYWCDYYRLGEFSGKADIDISNLPNLDAISTSDLSFYGIRLVADGYERGSLSRLDKLTMSILGYQRLDRRRDLPSTKQEGYVANHIHLMGITLPYEAFTYEVGIGRILGTELGSFSQQELNDWAGDDARFSYIFLHKLSLGFKLPTAAMDWLWEDKPLQTVVGVGYTLEHTQFGKIELANSLEGSFMAIGQKLHAELEFTNHSSISDFAALIIGIQYYRQHLHAKLNNGDSFSREDSGEYLISGKLELYYD